MFASNDACLDKKKLQALYCSWSSERMICDGPPEQSGLKEFEPLTAVEF